MLATTWVSSSLATSSPASISSYRSTTTVSRVPVIREETSYSIACAMPIISNSCARPTSITAQTIAALAQTIIGITRRLKSSSRCPRGVSIGWMRSGID